MFGEPELSIQERINIISSYLIFCTTFCTTSSILLIIYIYCLVKLYFSILFITTNYIPYNNSSYMEYNNFSYYDESFSL